MAMDKMSKNQIWEKVKALRGTVVHTIERGNPSLITEVTDTLARRRRPGSGADMASYAFDWEVYNTYCYAMDRGMVTGDDFPKVPGARPGGRNGRFILALLVAAVPEHIEAFRRSEEPSRPGKSGIRRRA